MKVTVWVRDVPIPIFVGPGNQRLKWLAMVAVQRYEAEGGEAFSQAHVPTGLCDADGTTLPPNKSVRVALEDEQEIYLLLQADEEESVLEQSARGTSTFVLTQGAAPGECLLDGPSLSYALAGQSTNFYLTARDTYGNLARNGALPSRSAAGSSPAPAAAPPHGCQLATGTSRQPPRPATQRRPPPAHARQPFSPLPRRLPLSFHLLFLSNQAARTSTCRSRAPLAPRCSASTWR